MIDKRRMPRAGKFMPVLLIVTLLLCILLWGCEGHKPSLEELREAFGVVSVRATGDFPDTIDIVVDASGTMKGYINPSSQGPSTYTDFVEYLATYPFGEAACVPYGFGDSIFDLDPQNGLLDAAHNSGQYNGETGFYTQDVTRLGEIVADYREKIRVNRGLVLITDMVQSNAEDDRGGGHSNWPYLAKMIAAYAKEGAFRLVGFTSSFQGKYWYECGRSGKKNSQLGCVDCFRVRPARQRPVYAMVFAATETQCANICDFLVSPSTRGSWLSSVKMLAPTADILDVKLASVRTPMYAPTSGVGHTNTLARHETFLKSSVFYLEWTPCDAASCRTWVEMQFDVTPQPGLSDLIDISQSTVLRIPTISCYEFVELDSGGVRVDALDAVAAKPSWSTVEISDTTTGEHRIQLGCHLAPEFPQSFAQNHWYVLRIPLMFDVLETAPADWISQWSTNCDNSVSEIGKTYKLYDIINRASRDYLLSDTLSVFYLVVRRM